MDDLYKVGERVSQDGARAAAAMDPAALEAAMRGNPELAELLAGGGNIEQYLQSYEQMLQEHEGMHTGGPRLGEVDAEGGITVRPDPGFVVKTRDQQSGTKVFLNIVSNEHVEAPHMKEFVELEGEQGCRVHREGTTGDDFDKKNEPCVTYDLVANPKVVEDDPTCSGNAQFKDTVIQLCISAVAQKYKVELDPRYKLPKVKYKGGAVQVQRLRKQHQSKIQERSGARPRRLGAPRGPETGARRRPAPRPPSRFLHLLLQARRSRRGRLLGEVGRAETGDMVSAENICGYDLPCYRVNEFQERIRGTMRTNRADRERAEEAREDRARCGAGRGRDAGGAGGQDLRGAGADAGFGPACACAEAVRGGGERRVPPRLVPDAAQIGPLGLRAADGVVAEALLRGAGGGTLGAEIGFPDGLAANGRPGGADRRIRPGSAERCVLSTPRPLASAPLARAAARFWGARPGSLAGAEWRRRRGGRIRRRNPSLSVGPCRVCSVAIPAWASEVAYRHA
ncbi:unnamed protein product [Prorocentrum cordatum]|uniref:PIH1 N-terminal domain-containing protein n=1 Tax=Prorocentrum cordatum TaxID=2364126 RepID=A0ABN9U3Y8_9DINO|nr:unnamed protein product [Polarella glacialis]